jgi:hypothetical protein
VQGRVEQGCLASAPIGRLRGMAQRRWGGSTLEPCTVSHARACPLSWQEQANEGDSGENKDVES